ncbi:hypothetical protein Dda_9198 [Drechslerella dactyloides]|uniref:Uncharacterized protein n=1 Tax=Drechslerella dactyloides TaxID=74499 RepID=A0AAD6NEM0_DREDA|nr:hypothetical protein Dda_9198 [Drechslerella dactyloides]
MATEARRIRTGSEEALSAGGRDVVSQDAAAQLHSTAYLQPMGQPGGAAQPPQSTIATSHQPPRPMLHQPQPAGVQADASRSDSPSRLSRAGLLQPCALVGARLAPSERPGGLPEMHEPAAQKSLRDRTRTAGFGQLHC